MAEADWSAAERWAWGEITAGRIADFHRDQGKALDPKEPEGWGESRTLRPDFLKEILFRSPWREQIPIEGVRITGALFTERVDLAHGRLGHQLWFHACRFAKGADLTGLHVDGALSLARSAFLGDTQAANGAAPAPLTLVGSRVTGSLAISGATVAGRLEMNGLTVGQHLFMHEGASFQEVGLVAAKIEGQLNLSGATVAGRLDMNSLTIGQHMVMKNVICRESIDLPFAQIGGTLDLLGAEISGLNLSATRVGGEFRPAAKWKESASLSLVNAHAGTINDRGQRDAWPATMELDGFSYDRLGGFASEATNVAPHISLIVESYTHDVMPHYPAEWFCDWLARDKTYAPQPYEQLATVLRAAGQPEKADAVLYAGRERARAEAWKKFEEAWKKFEGGRWLGLSSLKRTIGYGCRWLGLSSLKRTIGYGCRWLGLSLLKRTIGYGCRWLGLSLLKWLIGYGLGGRYFRALFWVLGLTIFGAVVLVHFAAEFPGGWITAAAYSLDRLLPLVELDPGFKDIRLSSWPRYLFMVYELAGYVLASFLVAGLAGLTQK